jgi:hypothetical protein
MDSLCLIAVREDVNLVSVLAHFERRLEKTEKLSFSEREANGNVFAALDELLAERSNRRRLNR